MKTLISFLFMLLCHGTILLAQEPLPSSRDTSGTSVKPAPAKKRYTIVMDAPKTESIPDTTMKSETDEYKSFDSQVVEPAGINTSSTETPVVEPKVNEEQTPNQTAVETPVVASEVIATETTKPVIMESSGEESNAMKAEETNPMSSESPVNETNTLSGEAQSVENANMSESEVTDAPPVNPNFRKMPEKKPAASTDGPKREWSNPPGYMGSQKTVTMTKHKPMKHKKVKRVKHRLPKTKPMGIPKI